MAVLHDASKAAGSRDVAAVRDPGRARSWSAHSVVPGVFLAYVAFAVLAWESFDAALGPAFFYPSAGITVAAFILSHRAVWPGIAGAVVVAELAVDALYGNPIVLSLAYAVSNVVEPFVGASLVLAWCGGRPDLRKRRDFRAFILGACLAGPAVGGLIGGSAKAVNGGFPWLSTAATWASGDGLGVLVIASPILLWALQAHILRRRPWETAGLLAVTAAISGAAFWAAAPPSMFTLPVLALAAFRLDMLGTALMGAVAALVSNIMTTRGYGLFASYDVSAALQVWLSQAYVAIITVVAMLIALEASARLRTDRERQVERRERLRLECLARLAHQLSAALTPEEIGRDLLAQLVNEAGAQALTMGLLSSDGHRLECVTMAGFPDSVVDRYASAGMLMNQHGIATDVVRSGTPVEFRSLAEYRAAYPDAAIVTPADEVEAIVGWPLSYGGEPFGVLVLMWSDPLALDISQRSYISAAATMASQALVRAKAYADQHAQAAVLRSLAQPAVQDRAVGLQYRALYRPADDEHGLGGDWYSVVTLPDGTTYLAVGDVMGHGLSSVQDMVLLRSTGIGYAHQGLSPAHVLTDLNRFAANQIQGEFATKLVAVFDPADSSLTYSSAGHLPALLRRAQTGEVIRLTDASGPVLGPFRDSEYVRGTAHVEPDDVLVMYTDGLVEHHEAGLTAGIDNLEQVVAAWSPEALLDCAELARVANSSPSPDDTCILVVKFGS